ncbi:MAG TPA: ATP-binding protein [Candidatus Limnocylindrales bacterium]|nr:ATP-binding protein [Candidatus Limnocylindrales bacterium]
MAKPNKKPREKPHSGTSPQWKEIDRRLREEQEFVRRLVACFPDVIVVLDTHRRYTFVSARVQDSLGYTPDEYVGTNLGERQHPEDRDRVLQFFNDLITGKSVVGTMEYRTRHKDGAWKTFRASASPLTDAEGKIIGVVSSARDVTESKRLEQQLLQSEKLAAIGQMVSGVAHELNNPLTAILGVSDLLRERASDDASRRQIELVQKQARKAVELVQGLLSFSRPSRPQNRRVRLEDVAKRAMELQQAALASRHITVELETAAELPEVEADPNHMVQVLVNLIANAEQAIASVRDHGRILIHMGKAEDKAEVLIDDDGPGIPADMRSKIFDPFVTTRRASGGSGMGLAISLVIVKEHGGTIEAQSSPQGGARLRILLPAVPSVADSPALARPISRRDGLNGCSILVVEDEEGIRDLVAEHLKGLGAAVEAVQTGEEAWSRLCSGACGLVLCDLNLGDMSGAELFARVRARTPAQYPKFLFMTGELLDRSQIAVIEQQGARVLQKPFQLSELASTVEEFIASPAPVPK